MKKTSNYPNNWIPYPIMLHPDFWYGEEKNVKELILKNNYINELGISEMGLYINKFHAIDDQGNEHHILEISDQNTVTIKGISNAHFLKTRSMNKLPKGTYSLLRFYLSKKDHKFISADGEVKQFKDIQYLDFEIENGFTVSKLEENEVKLWFDLAPFKFSRHFKAFKNVFKGLLKPENILTNGLST